MIFNQNLCQKKYLLLPLHHKISNIAHKHVMDFSLPPYYFYGLAAMLYLTSCWFFSAVRWWHTCRAPKERYAYIWPDRKLQVLVYAVSVVLLPYVINPNDEAAWLLMKSYFPGTYFFYCGLLMLCFTGTVKQWTRWKSISWIAAIIVIATMLIPVLNAWLPFRCLNSEGLRFWQTIITIESIIMMGYSSIAMGQVGRWLHEARDASYSNPDDFPADYARRVWLMPLALVPILWPAYIMDSKAIMAVEHVLLAIFNVVLLITVLPAWRRKAILLTSSEDEHDPYNDNSISDSENTESEERMRLIAEEIESYVIGKKAFLDQHLKLDDVVSHTSYSRTYVSMTLQHYFGSFANYINHLRLIHYEQYIAEHPNETMESAAQASGFSSYNSYYRAKQKEKKSYK